MTSTIDAGSLSSLAAASASVAAAAASASAEAALEAILEATVQAEAPGTLGALLEGGLFSFLLHGFACAQVWEYYTKYKSDSWQMKLLVAIIFLLNIVHRAFSIDFLWWYLITRGNNDVFNMIVASWSVMARLIPSEIAVTLVQCFFVTRLWLFSGRKLVAWILLIPVAASLAFGMIYTARVFNDPAFSDSFKQKWLVICYSSIRAGTDILISGILCILIYQKGKVSMRYLKGVLRILFQYAITTGVVASATATIVVITFVTMPDNLVYVAIYDIYGILFFNCMMASLINREGLRAAANQGHVLSDLSGSGSNSVRVQVPMVHTVEYTYDDRHPSKYRYATEGENIMMSTMPSDVEANRKQ